MYKHILVPTDFSDDSCRAAVQALSLAELSNAKLSVIHVVDYLPPAYIYALGEHSPVAELAQLAEDYLAEWVEKIGLGEAERLVESGSAGREIAKAAKEKGVDLIVIGSSGKGGMKRLLGSTTRSVMHDAKCDVLSIRRD